MTDPATPAWQEVHEKLARARAALEEALNPSPQRRRAVLEERARLLARQPQGAGAADEGMLLVAFRLADERFAVEARYVREVLRLGGCTPLPGAPPFVHGIVNLRGEILDVLDLRPLLGLPGNASSEPAGPAARVVVLGVDRAEMGLLVDAAEEVVRVPAADLHDPPDSITGPGREYLRGVTAEAVSILDGAVLLRDERLFVEQAEEGNA
jgi:purine-binding chemotaxis protein CheW